MPFERIIRRIRRRGPTLSMQLESRQLRAEYAAKGVDIGLYSYGCFDLSRVPPGVTVGRYCSFANSAQIFLRNHGLQYLGLTAYFYNRKLGVVDEETIALANLVIGDDVWLGHNSIILPNTKMIGRGAAVAAGAVVTKPVPAYAIVAGNPARIVKMRFDDRTIAAIEESCWWEKTPTELQELVRDNPQMVFSPDRYFASADKTGSKD